ncbi:Quinate permease [Zalerion maritima]|uniref:Quinate permease n=1 Tax=Zalerion maritima TaxID=339359 RepID=A0AAD5RH52_9PEZI|nr:Quinate permease [Zalerion maritima]
MATMSRTNTSSSAQFDSKQHLNSYIITVIFFLSLSSISFGYTGAIIATTLTQPSFHKHMKLDTNPNATALISAINGLFYTGGAIGSFLAGWTSSRYGRKWSAVVGNVIILVAGGCLTASVNPAMFIVFRFFCGVGAFQLLASIPLWLAEVAPPKMRGIVTDCHAVMMLLGYTIACYVGVGFYFDSGENQWRGPIGMQMVFPTIVLCGLYWMPESPRFLLSKGRAEEAWRVVRRMHSNPNDPVAEFAKREFYQMRKQIDLDNTFATSYLGIFKDKSLRKRAVMTIFLEFCLMSSGILVILNYGSIIWRNMGFDTVQVLNFQGGFQLTGFVFNVVAMLFVDRVKRNWLMVVGFVSCATVMSCHAALQKYYVASTERGGLIADATMIFLFQTVYSLFLDGPTFFYIAEIWPSHVRSQGFAIGMATLSLTAMLWLEVAPQAFEDVGWKLYLAFVAIPIVGAITIALYFPDTHQKPLEEIAALFGDADRVAVYQRELDSSHMPLDVIEQSIPNLTATSSGGVETGDSTTKSDGADEIEKI